MVKKFNNDEIFIKGFPDMGIKPAEIIENISKNNKETIINFPKAFLLEKKNFNKPIVRKKKLNDEKIKNFIEKVQNKTTSEAS